MTTKMQKKQTNKTACLEFQHSDPLDTVDIHSE